MAQPRLVRKGVLGALPRTKDVRKGVVGTPFGLILAFRRPEGGPYARGAAAPCA